MLGKVWEVVGSTCEYRRVGGLISKNCDQEICEGISVMLGMEECEKDITYLGNPLFIGRNKTKNFEALKKKIFGCIEGWMEKSISKARRTTLIKSVVQGILSYAMSTFHLPKTFWLAIEKATRQFRQVGEVLGGWCMALVAWERICQPKSHKGLGFRKLKDLNKAYLAKLVWFLATKPNLFSVRILRDKYCRGRNFLNHEMKKKVS